MPTSKAILILALVLTVGSLAPSGTSGKPIKEPAPLPESFVDPTCGFPILIEVLEQNEFIKIFESGRAIVTGTLKVRLSAGGKEKEKRAFAAAWRLRVRLPCETRGQCERQRGTRKEPPHRSA